VLAVRSRAPGGGAAPIAPTSLRLSHAGTAPQTLRLDARKRWGPAAAWKVDGVGGSAPGRHWRGTGTLRVEVWGYKQGGGGAEVCLGFAEVPPPPPPPARGTRRVRLVRGEGRDVSD
jgi:hypothetical protein